MTDSLTLPAVSAKDNDGSQISTDPNHPHCQEQDSLQHKLDIGIEWVGGLGHSMMSTRK